MRPCLLTLAALALVASLAAGPVRADGTPIRVLFDDSAGSVGAARFACNHERLAEPGELRRWERNAAGMATTMALGGGLLGAAAGDTVEDMQRLATIAPLTEQLPTDRSLERHLVTALERALASDGQVIEQSFSARAAAVGYLQRDPSTPTNTRALVVGRVDGPLVRLNWDDRHLLVEVSLRHYVYLNRKYRERSKVDLHYIGYPAPTGESALEHWATDGAAAFRAELDRAFATIFALGLTPQEMPARPGRKDIVALQVGADTHEYHGRLWKELDGVAVLVNRKGALVLVATAPAGAALAQE